MILLSSFIFGLVFGSFLNVIIYRLKTRQNIVFGGSFCPECKASLKWHDLIPLLSFIYLGGHCRYCHKKISWQYPIVEFLSGGLWLAVFYKFGVSPANIYYIFVLSIFLIIAVYDFKWRIIPDKIIYPAIAAAFIYNIFPPDKGGLWGVLLAAASAFLFFFFIFYFSKGRAMGLGDAKLAFLIGIFLGPLLTIAALTLAFIVGAFIGIILIMLGKKTMQSQIAFGPMLVFGTAVVFFFSNFIIKLFQP